MKTIISIHRATKSRFPQGHLYFAIINIDGVEWLTESIWSDKMPDKSNPDIFPLLRKRFVK